MKTRLENGITASLDPQTVLLAKHQLKLLPANKPFLEVVSNLLLFFNCLRSPVVTVIQAAISGNITKIKAVYSTDLAKFWTLQNILEVEKEMYRAEWLKVEATLALMWLKRGLCNGEQDESHPDLIHINATKAYEMVLRKYHSWIVQKIFQAVLYAMLYKSDFLKVVSKDQNVTEEECLEKVHLFLVNYMATIDVIYRCIPR